MRPYERLLNYAVVKTPCGRDTDQVPTTACQFDLARLLADELRQLGAAEVTLDGKCFVYGVLPATPGYEDRVRLGFIAHMDTVPAYCEGDIVPVLTERYDGRDLPLGNSGRVLTVKDFPHLPELAGRTLITSDGTTILGVDDKAGVAEIMTLVERLQTENIPHGQISVAFTPDEECGAGVEHFDLDRFGADAAYTLDGGGEGGIEYENFNACKAEFRVRGVSVHPGSAKDVMVNAALLATEINAMLPAAETPRHTEGYEGFYHLTDIHGDDSEAAVRYIVRDHDSASFAARKATLRHIEKTMNETWGPGTVTLTITDQYRNMAEIIAAHRYLIDYAQEACRRAGVPARIAPIRGGTDGCRLSFRGLPCPNLGTGGYGYHGPYEHCTAEGMDRALDIIVELVKLFAERER